MTLVLLLSIVNLSMFSGRFRFWSKTLQSYKLFLTWQNFSPFFFLSFSYFAVIRASIRKASAKLRTLFVSAKFLYIYFFTKYHSMRNRLSYSKIKITITFKKRNLPLQYEIYRHSEEACLTNFYRLRIHSLIILYNFATYYI